MNDTDRGNEDALLETEDRLVLGRVEDQLQP